ncbi:MAG: helix-turn-helix domain-containing protein [Egibacteraceae bacterium]
MTAPGTSRYCRGCGCRIARDNRTSWCSPCQHREFERTARAPQQPEAFWETDHIRDALASRDMGAVVRAYRHHPAHGPRPLTQVRLAGWLGITQPHLSRIESGRSQIRDLDTLEHYARCLRIPAYLLWFAIDEQEEQPLHPAEAVKLPGGLDVTVAVAPTGPALAAHLRGNLRHYVAMDNLTGPRPLLTIAAQQIAFIEQLVANATGTGRADLLDTAARFTEFAGWLHQDAGNLRAAMHWTNTALDYAQEAGDARMVCYVLMRKSNIASDAGCPGQALAFAEAGLAEHRHLTPHLARVSWLVVGLAVNLLVIGRFLVAWLYYPCQRLGA